MPRFAANISTMFTERPLLERVLAAVNAGFDAIECQFPYEVPALQMAAVLDQAGVPLVLINTPPGDAEAGERGLAALPGRETEFRKALDQALAYATTVGCKNIHVMAGVQPDGIERGACLEVFEKNLRHAVVVAAESDVSALLIEPINTRDIPGYVLNLPEQAAALIRDISADNLKLQYDFYHTQIMRGNVAAGLQALLPIIGHVQFAGVPERQEPDIGELNCDYLFDFLDRLGYAGWVGAEYFPSGETEDGLGWAVRYGIRPKPTQLATGGLLV